MTLYDQQLETARGILRTQGREALNNPHAMIGRQCRCGDCFTCAAAQIVREHDLRQRALPAGA